MNKESTRGQEIYQNVFSDAFLTSCGRPLDFEHIMTLFQN